MPTKVLIFAGDTPSQLYGTKQVNNSLLVYSACCGAHVTSNKEAVTCTYCKTARTPKRTSTDPIRLDPVGFYFLYHEYKLHMGRENLDFWVGAWTGLKVKVTVED